MQKNILLVVICILGLLFSACANKKVKSNKTFVSTKCDMVCSNTECNQVCTTIEGTLK
ncbi:hypothetical protein [Helicobacter didelphidarum]|uniref:hypothetical protein n=1 Tax=Helicobacter didelphidarum TaxID=2040648 RepID=UPI0015F15DCB|nr:hypothetical protein [Helicobacter didelphidarum]